MLSKDNFTKEHIVELRRMGKADPAILERTLFAFGLLEALLRTEMPFIFKGGTALLLLLDKPMRLSTDIDIIVEPDTDVDKYIQEAGRIFPFLDCHEDVRKGRNNIEKRHYKFIYRSPSTGKDVNILLDILFDECPYSDLTIRPLKNDLLITEGDDFTVRLPEINCILADKLTAFAPHTTGIPFGIGKELEIIKQMYDCWTLFQHMTDFDKVKQTYHAVVEKELAYRDLQLQPAEVLSDTVQSCLCLMGRGSIRKDEYPFYIAGIDRLRGHLWRDTLMGENAGLRACSILYLAAHLITDRHECTKLSGPEHYQNISLKVKNARRLSYIKDSSEDRPYAYLIEAYNLLGDKHFVLE